MAHRAKFFAFALTKSEHSRRACQIEGRIPRCRTKIQIFSENTNFYLNEKNKYHLATNLPEVYTNILDLVMGLYQNHWQKATYVHKEK